MKWQITFDLFNFLFFLFYVHKDFLIMQILPSRFYKCYRISWVMVSPWYVFPSVFIFFRVRLDFISVRKYYRIYRESSHKFFIQFPPLSVPHSIRYMIKIKKAPLLHYYDDDKGQTLLLLVSSFCSRIHCILFFFLNFIQIFNFKRNSFHTIHFPFPNTSQILPHFPLLLSGVFILRYFYICHYILFSLTLIWDCNLITSLPCLFSLQTLIQPSLLSFKRMISFPFLLLHI